MSCGRKNDNQLHQQQFGGAFPKYTLSLLCFFIHQATPRFDKFYICCHSWKSTWFGHLLCSYTNWKTVCFPLCYMGIRLRRWHWIRKISLFRRNKVSSWCYNKNHWTPFLSRTSLLFTSKQHKWCWEQCVQCRKLAHRRYKPLSSPYYNYWHSRKIWKTGSKWGWSLLWR